MEDDRIVISSGATLTPESVTSRIFATGFRGYDQDEVRTFLKRVADELSMVVAREGELRETMQEALHRAAHPELDEETLTSALGEHAARLLTNARDAAANIVSEAETRAARIIGEAESKIARVRAEADSLFARRSEEAERLTSGLRTAVEADVRAQRERARAEAESEVESARAQGREMVGEARSVRERMLADLARRRRIAEVQIEQLRLARQRILEAYGVVRRTVDEATSELAAAEVDAERALAADASGRPPTVEVDADALARPSAPGPSEDTASDKTASSDAAFASPPTRSRPGGGGSRSTNGDPGPPGKQRTPARSGSGPPKGAPVVQPPRPPAGVTGSASGPASGKDASPATVPVTTVERARSLVSVPPPTDTAGPAPRELARSGGGGDRPGPASDGTLTAKPSHSPDDRAVEAPGAASAPATEPVAHAVPDPPAAATPDHSPASPEADAASVAQVDVLFARMRAAQSGATSGPAPDIAAERPPAPSRVGAPAKTEGPAASGSGAPPTPARPTGSAATTTVVADESSLSKRDASFEPLAADLVRQLKRVLQDDHNEVLDRLRQQRRAVPDAVLPDAGAQTQRYSAVARPLLAEAARLGGASVAAEGASAVPAREVDQWAAEFATDLVGPLRDRLESALRDASSAADDDADPGAVTQATSGGAVADRISSGYRQWKSQQIEPVARHHAIRAYCRGAFVATPEGANLRWLLDDDGPCPDCEDNVLAGAQVKGQEFPTGQVHPPAHMGCRCLLAVTTP